ncbi:MAG: Lrp/AsnC family transcriptional regulator, partial [Chloroflexi bacterium]|nr:Lrp/AsnC family transcriptional regulator [Chloroflexota bacterium]
MDLVDRKILNVIQTRFPLVEKPFEAVGEEIGIPESEVIERVAERKSKNVVRQISAIFDTRRLGYKTTLVAMRLPADELDAAAQVINEHPGVSHNYARNGHFNLWFTLAVP